MSTPKKNMFNADNLEIINFKIVEENTSIPEIFDSELISEYTSEFETQLRFNLEKELIRTSFDLHITTVSENEKEAISRFQFILIYKYKDIVEMTIVEKEGFKIKSQLGFAISSITHSTVRGALLIKLKDSVFEKYILPIVKPELPKVGG